MDSLRIEDTPAQAPKWLDVLENRRKRPHRLAHEIGAGSPCLVCKENCKGLNLHFWRKICIECKCRKEDHDFVDDEEYVQFEILFGAKRVKKTTMKYNANNKTFDWVPQNVSQELVVDYLNAIPESKLPITDSVGANHRKQQLEKQLPVHDVNPNACHNLTDKEIAEFEKYLENLRRNVIGQGQIMKYKLCDNIYGPYFSTETSTSEPGTVKPYTQSIQRQLIRGERPEAVTIFSEKIKAEPEVAKIISKIDVMNHNEMIAKSTPQNTLKQYSSGLSGRSLSPHEMQNLSISRKSNAQPVNVIGRYLNNAASGTEDGEPNYDRQNNNGQVFKQDNFNKQGDGSCPASSIYANNLRNQIPISDEASFEKSVSSPMNIMNASSSEVPFTLLQESKAISRGRGISEKDETKQLDNPYQPMCDKISKLDNSCVECGAIFAADDIVIKTERGGEHALWHARCFICDTCKELLVDLMYFYHDGKVFCGRDYAKVRNIPRCFACDELIFLKEYTEAEGNSYHYKHFCCYHCDVPLGGKQYIPSDGQPVCLDCYQDHYGKTCTACSKTISVADQRVSLGDFHFHVAPECFRCQQCSKYLAGEKLVFKQQKMFCSKECYQQFQS